MRYKYIREKRTGFIIWPANAAMHSEVATRMHLIVHSAGFVQMAPEGLVCFGESESLGVTSDPEDTALIRQHLLG